MMHWRQAWEQENEVRENRDLQDEEEWWEGYEVWQETEHDYTAENVHEKT